jgi:uncharacterized membrane protein YidH (DUF202 family)
MTGARPNGAAVERTELAWVRTTLAYGICALLCLHLARRSFPLELAVLGLATAGTAGVAFLTARRRRPAPDLGTPAAADPARVAALAALVGGLGLAAAVLIAVR